MHTHPLTIAPTTLAIMTLRTWRRVVKISQEGELAVNGKDVVWFAPNDDPR